MIDKPDKNIAGVKFLYWNTCGKFKKDSYIIA